MQKILGAENVVAPPENDAQPSMYQRTDVRRELFKNYLKFTETALMQNNDQDAGPELAKISKVIPYAESKEDVMLDPVVFREITKRLKFKPTIDLFAIAQHHQVPRYCSARYDPK